MKQTYPFLLLNFFFLFCGLFLFSGCGEKFPCPDDAGATLPIHEYWLDGYDFKPGSYWVYWDSANQWEDSIAIVGLAGRDEVFIPAGDSCDFYRSPARFYMLSSSRDSISTFYGIGHNSLLFRRDEIEKWATHWKYYKIEEEGVQSVPGGYEVQGHQFPEVDFSTSTISWHYSDGLKFKKGWMAPGIGVIREEISVPAGDVGGVAQDSIVNVFELRRWHVEL